MQRTLPVLVEKDETGFYVLECPLFDGCFAQGKTLDDARKNLREVIDLLLDEPENRQIWDNYRPESVQFTTLTHA